MTINYREYSFRAKDRDGVWVEGLLHYNAVQGAYNIVETQFRRNTTHDLLGDQFNVFHQIDINTIGQYTELNDRDKNKIWEGDIMELKLPLGGFWGKTRKTEIGVVRYEPERGSYIVEWKYTIHQHHIILDCNVAFEGKVIGNIHDNPTFFDTED